MNYLKVKRHIIDKNSFLFSSIIIFVSLILSYLIYLNGFSFSFRSIILILLILILSLSSLIYIFINLLRCRNFNVLWENRFKKYDICFCKIDIKQDDYKIQALYSSYTATMSSFPKATNAIYIETGEFMLLFFSIKQFGFIQTVLKPFIFLKNEKISMQKEHLDIIRDFDSIETTNGKIIIFPNKHGIKEIIIPRNVYYETLP